jgi:hypothetical protein
MFFQISDKLLDNFPTNYQHNNLYVNLDHGWHTTFDQHNNRIFYKGYLDNLTIADCVLDIACQEEPVYTGNFCLIKCFDQGITVKTDRYRSFPMFFSGHGLTNLYNTGDPVHTDSFVMITNNLDKVESKFNLLQHSEYKQISMQECVDKIDNILTNKFQTFFKHNKLPLHVFLSGGIDTTTLYSYVLKLNIPHVLVNYLHTDLDYFYLKNHHTLSNFWGYKQIHYWSSPCVLLSGTPGDEFTVRSPTTANMMLKHHSESIDDLLDSFKESLHYRYFLRYTDLFRSQQSLSFITLTSAINECLNIILNDYQHWHLGETLCYTPLRDVEIFSTIASLHKQDLIKQIFNSRVQKELIMRNAPHLLDSLSTDKNTDNYMSNLTNLYTRPPQGSNL